MTNSTPTANYQAEYERLDSWRSRWMSLYRSPRFTLASQKDKIYERYERANRLIGELITSHDAMTKQANSTPTEEARTPESIVDEYLEIREGGGCEGCGRLWLIHELKARELAGYNRGVEDSAKVAEGSSRNTHSDNDECRSDLCNYECEGIRQRAITLAAEIRKLNKAG